MAKQDKPLKVEIPKPSDEGPAWSRVGIIAAVGFVVGIAWPRIAGVKIGPNAPDDDKPQAAAVSSAAPNAAPASPSATPAPASAAPAASGAPAAEAAPAANKELVVVGPGKVTRCKDKKNKKVDDCDAIELDAIATPRLKELANCPSAIGLDGKMAIGLEVDFERKDVQVSKGKKTTLPTSTINGILQCAAQQLTGVNLEGVTHKYKKYTVFYTAAFYPPGKHPDGDGKPSAGESDGAEGAAAGGAADASGQATVNWDTALVRKQPKDGDVVARLVRGTKVKLVGRQDDWYKVEHGSKTGWVHRAAIGL